MNQSPIEPLQPGPNRSRAAPWQMPEIPEERRTSAIVPLRFEDISQDGRLGLVALTAALGDVAWRQLIVPRPHAAALAKLGIAPVLSRLVVEGGGGPFAPFGTLESTAEYDFAHVAEASGGVDRLLLNVWADATLPIGKSFGPRPERAGERVRAGRLFGEHVLTRLTAPPEARRVTELPGLPFFPGTRVAAASAIPALELPEGATPLEETARVDPTPIVPGLSHTDSNQHVTTLTYPRLFEEAALRRFAELGHSTPLLARGFDATFRKPCFAGQRYMIALQAFVLDGRLGASGAFFSAKDLARPLADARHHCCVQMSFEA
jgi:hypothetical protein